MIAKLTSLFSRNAVLLMAFAIGASTALSFAPYSIWPIYPIALGLALWQSPTSTKKAFKYWLSFGFGAFSFGISWVHVSMSTYGGIPLIASMALMAVLALYLALYPALTGLVLQKLRPKTDLWRNLAVFPALWALSEWLRGWVMTGFPWLWAGYSQTEGPLRPLASVIGTLGISFLLALVAGALALCLQKRWKPLAIIIPILLVSIYLTNAFPGITITGKTVKVALVQGNIPQSMKWQPEALWPTLSKYMDLSRPIMEQDIVIWPEAAIPAPKQMVPEFIDNANKVANLRDSAIITGIISNEQNKFYNSLIVLGHHNQVTADGELNSQPKATKDNVFSKHHLLPIGEFVPFESLLRPIAPLFNLPQSSFSHGPYIQPNLTALGYRIAPAICYEIAFPEQVRANTHSDTDMLLTVSNDAWFGTSNGPLQHMEIAQMRAVEMGRPLLRATNNGVTAVVNANGDIINKLPQFTTGVLIEKVPLVAGMTVFKRLGEWPVLMISLLIVFITLARKKWH